MAGGAGRPAWWNDRLRGRRLVPEHLLGPVEGPLGVDHPVPAAGGGEGGLELAGIGKMHYVRDEVLVA